MGKGLRATRLTRSPRGLRVIGNDDHLIVGFFYSGPYKPRIK